ncbi:MAG: hypothetical protein F8N37_20175 [Telmatospirillum sp.]|nr:hypothetical protein [Telmatospirillum sp.]
MAENRPPEIRFVAYTDAKGALAGSTREQQIQAVRICAGLLGIDEREALKIDPEVGLPAFWAVLQYRGLTRFERGRAVLYLDRLRASSMPLFQKIQGIVADLGVNPEWYPWSLTDAELDAAIRRNRIESRIWHAFGFSGLAVTSVVAAFAKPFREKVLTIPVSTILKGSLKSFTPATVLINAYVTSLDEAAAEEGFEALRRKEREGRERMAEDIETQQGVPVNRLILGPSPIERALY